MRSYAEEIEAMCALSMDELDEKVAEVMARHPRQWTTARRVTASLLGNTEPGTNLSPVLTACSSSYGWNSACIRVSASLRRLATAGRLEVDTGTRTLRYRRNGE